MQGAVLSAAATQAATAAAAAAGLTFVRELPMECWVLLKRADGKTDSAGTAAAIQVLKGSSDEVMTAGACTSHRASPDFQTHMRQQLCLPGCCFAGHARVLQAMQQAVRSASTSFEATVH